MAELARPDSAEFLTWGAQKNRKNRRYFVLPPSNLSAEIATTNIVLSWDEMPMAVGYSVYLWGGSAWELQGSVSDPTYSTPSSVGTHLFGVVADYFSAGLSEIQTVQIVVE